MAGELTIGSLRVTIGADTKPLEDGRKRAEQELGRVEKRMDRLRGVALKVGAALGAALAVGKFISLGRDALAAADQIGKLSQALGVSTEYLSQMRHAVELSGASFDQFTTALRQFSRVMSEAVEEPTGRAAQQLRALGISLVDAQGNVRSTEAILSELADAFASHADGASKAAVAMALFGDEGARLIPLLNQGSRGIQEMRDEADRLGQTIDQNLAQNAAKFNDQWTRIQKSIGGFVNIVIQHVLPIMERIADGMQRFVQNGEKMRSVSNFISGAMTVLASILAKVGAELHAVEAALRKFLEASQLAAGFEFGRAWEAAKAGVAAYNDIVAKGERHIDALWEKHRRFMEEANAPTGAPISDDRPSMRFISGGSGSRSSSSISESRKELDEMLDQLDLVMDRLYGLPNVIGEAYTINVTSFQDALAAIDEAVMKGALTQERATQMKLRLTEQEQNAYKQTAQVAAQAIATLFPKSKAAAIASAIINTAVAVTEALKLPPPLNFVQAGLVAAAGAAQIATIQRTNMGGGSSHSGVGSGAGVIGSGSHYYRGGNQPQGPLDMGTVLTVRGINPAEWFNGEALRELAEKLVQHQKDGGTVVFAPQ